MEERETDFLPPLPSALERHVRLVKDGDTLGVQVRQDDLHFLKRDFIPTILDTGDLQVTQYGLHLLKRDFIPMILEFFSLYNSLVLLAFLARIYFLTSTT